jgi:hypothetical protein
MKKTSTQPHTSVSLGLPDVRLAADRRFPAAAPLAAPALPPLVLVTTGTSGGGWWPVANALLAGAPAGVELRQPGFDKGLALDAPAANTLAGFAPASTTWGLADERAVMYLDTLATAFPESRFLLFVASPAAVLAEALAASRDADISPQRLLAQWRAGAANVLRHAQRHAGRSVLVSAAEAAAHPAALAALCSETFGLPFQPAERPAALAPLPAALASALAASDRAAAALFNELDAACTPLTDDDAPAGGFDAEQAAQAFVSLQQAASMLEARQTQQSSLQQENELILLHLHQVQEELEKYYLELQQVKQEQLAISTPASGLTAASLTVGHPRLTPPHLELEFLLQDVRHRASEALPELRLRLVEHHGRPGLTLFASHQRKPLAQWFESGQEDGQPFMLLVPGDAPTVPRLAALSADDWDFVNALVALLVQWLHKEALIVGRRWSGIAERLQRELAELPASLRFGSAEPQTAAGALDIRFTDVAWATRRLPELQLHLPAGRDGQLELVLGDLTHNLPPLAAWPPGDDGTPVPRLTLQWRGGPASHPAAAAWAALTPIDRAFIASLMARVAALAAGWPVHAEAAQRAARLAAAPPSMSSRLGVTAARSRRLLRRLLGRAPSAA